MRCAGVLFMGLLFGAPFLLHRQAGSSEQASSRYLNELANFRFYQNAPWQSLVLLASTFEDCSVTLKRPTTCRNSQSLIRVTRWPNILFLPTKCMH
jgi:hypothetical protein